MTPELIDHIRAYAYVFHHGWITAYDAEDLAQEVLLGQLLGESSDTRNLRQRMVDALRRIKRSRRVAWSHMPCMDVGVADWKLSSGQSRYDVYLCPADAKEQNAVPRTAAEAVRSEFERCGCLWTREFHSWLEQHLADAKPVVYRYRSTAVLGWIERNPGANPTQAWLAETIGADRSYLAKELKRMVDDGEVRRERAQQSKGKGIEGGKWSYWVMNE